MGKIRIFKTQRRQKAYFIIYNDILITTLICKIKFAQLGTIELP